MSKDKLLLTWWQATRYHFIPPSIFPVCVGALVSWAGKNTFSLWYFFLVLIAVVLNHIALNMTDDYFDYKHSVDILKPGEKNPYTGGSGTLTSGAIKPISMFRVFMVFYAITIIIGFYLVYERGLPILIFGLIGVFSSFFYTAPPIKFSHHGFGEIVMLINFGTILGLGSFYIQSQLISLEAFFATLPCGIMLFSMIVINEIPDIEEDKRAGKLTLVARYGVVFGIRLYEISWIVTYSVLILGVILLILPYITLIALLTIPLTYRSIKILKRNYHDPKKLAPANLDMIRSHSITCILIILSYLIIGYYNNITLDSLIVFVIIFGVIYLPAAFTIFGRIKK
ncbi:MAG: prenyltransferase [Candidatus Hodarchaeota archaeon]